MTPETYLLDWLSVLDSAIRIYIFFIWQGKHAQLNYLTDRFGGPNFLLLLPLTLTTEHLKMGKRCKSRVIIRH